MSQRLSLGGDLGHRARRADTIRSIDLSSRVCQGLGADFRRKSEIRKPALWGRKAGTDRLCEGIPEGFRPTEQALRALEARSDRPCHTRPIFSVAPAFSPPF